jgi:hypothetical protein
MRGPARKFGPRITVSLQKEDFAGLEAIAKDSDVSISWVVRRAVSEFLDRHGNRLQRNLPFGTEENTSIAAGNQ